MKVLAAMTEGAMAKQIERARGAYYRGLPIMTDRDYDALEEALRAVNPDHPVLKHSGADPTTKLKVKLPFPMPSLTKIKYLTGGVGQWLADHPGPYCVSWKIDGISGLHVPARRKLYTRGRSSGTHGGDISHLVPHLKKLPEPKGDFVVRGELVMRNTTFTAKYGHEYANPRNMVGGLTNVKTVHPATKDVTYLAYELLVPRLKPSAAFAKLKSLGYDVAPFKVFPALTEEKLLALLQAARANTGYEVDGLVIAQDVKTGISKGDPDHVVAFKSDTEDDSAKTTVVDVQWNLTRTGWYFPRIEVKPVVLKGATVTYASAKSAAFVRDNGIGPGAVIKLRRSGDVIPDIRAEDVLKPGKLKWPKDHVWDGANIKPASGVAGVESVLSMRLSHFFTVLGIDRFKPATVAKYIRAGFDTPQKILRMTEKQFTEVEGVSRLSHVVYQDVQRLKTDGVWLHTLMYASGLFGRAFGSRKLGAICTAHPKIMDYALWPVAKLQHLVDEIPGFDVKQAYAFAHALPKFARFAASTKLAYEVEKKARATGSKLRGVSVLFTGFRDAELEELVLRNGGTLATSVKTATVLLAKDPSGSSSKLGAARALGTRILTAEQFRRKYGL